MTDYWRTQTLTVRAAKRTALFELLYLCGVLMKAHLSAGDTWCSVFGPPHLAVYVVAQLVEALRQKSEGRGFDSRWCHCNFSDLILPDALWPWDWLSLWQKWVSGTLPGSTWGWCIGLTTLPPSCADSLEIMGASISWNPQDLSRPVMGLFYLLDLAVSMSKNWFHYVWTVSDLVTKIPGMKEW